LTVQIGQDAVELIGPGGALILDESGCPKQGAAYETGFHTHIMKPQFAVIQTQRFVSRPIFWK
jgi:hypothetical protein